jgi:AcrR family transcriptional regulator
LESLQLVPKEGIRERKKRLTHERICDVASKLFVEQGYSNTTIDAIAALADISKPTFFNYFSSKIAVLHEIIDIMDEQFVSYITDELDNHNSTLERLKHMMRRSALFIETAPEITRLTLVEGMGAIGDIDKSQPRFKRMHGAMGQLIKSGIVRGDVRKDYPIELLIQILFGSYLYSLLTWLSGQQHSLAKSLDNTAIFLAESIAPKT